MHQISCRDNVHSSTFDHTHQSTLTWKDLNSGTCDIFPVKKDFPVDFQKNPFRALLPGVRNTVLGIFDYRTIFFPSDIDNNS